MTPSSSDRPSTLEYHTLLALADGSRYGYAIKEAIERESRGTVTPGAGSLYRVLARLMSRELVQEVEPEKSIEPHPGLARRYYAMTPTGRRALAAEADRLAAMAEIAHRRLGPIEGAS